MDAPRRPSSTDGLDGRWTAIAGGWERPDLIDRWLETGPVHATVASTTDADADATTAMEVRAVPDAQGPLDGIIGAILGFLFG
jgi:hypothetical protein